MRKRTLLIGNGPNRVTHDAHSWSAVLCELAAQIGQPAVMAGSKVRPFTLIFEELALRMARRGRAEDELKGLVAERMARLQPNEVHRRIMALPVEHLLTTNYDYCLEATAGGTGICVDLHSESRYSLFRCREAASKRVWHIHGEIAKPGTIMLGHDHYVGYLHKARNYLTTDGARSRAGQYDYRSPVLHRRYNFEEDAAGYSWLDLFLRDDVHIAGFGFDYSEIAMWWLVGYKARLGLSDGRLPKRIEVGRSIFYCFREDALEEPLRGQLEVLHDLGVEIVRVTRGASYMEGWGRMCDALSFALSNDR